MNQEPSTNEEIATFCSTKFNVSFPMMAKISVKGREMDPLYKWLTTKSENGVKDSKVKWNFQKYLINENGQLYDTVSPQRGPFTKKIVEWIETK